MARASLVDFLRSSKSSLLLSSTNYVCPSCAISQLRVKDRRNATRQASTLVSATAVNARKAIPGHLKRLHGSLDRLRSRAGNYVDLSRLQLAMQGLESTRPKVRIAVLGLESQKPARHIARLLAADPLESKGLWEEQLTPSDDDDTDLRSILLTYGSEQDRSSSSALVKIMHIPSPFLRSNNLEILIATLEAPTDALRPQPDLAESAMVPLIGIPTSSTGGVSMVRHPVHRTLVIAEGLHGCQTLGKWNLHGTQGAKDLQLKTALNIPGYSPAAETQMDFSPIDLREAEKGLDRFRESTDNGGIYGSKWAKSGLAQVTKWVGTNRDLQTVGLIPAVRVLLEDIINRADAKVVVERSRMALRRSDVPDKGGQLDKLNAALSKWAAASHSELHDRLECAFSSDDWARLKWYKLLWRVDDVDLILSRLLERFWLLDSEKRMIWLSGRATEAGLLPEETALALLAPPRAAAESPAEELERTDAFTAWRSATLQSSGSQIRHRVTPKHTGIEEERRWLRQTTIPALQRQAQGLIVQTFSYSGIAGGLSALVYLTWPGMGVDGAGAFAALGLVWALRRLQTEWESARMRWSLELERQGQRVLKATEDNLRALIARGPTATGSTGASMEDVDQAQAALNDAQAALDEVTGARERAVT